MKLGEKSARLKIAAITCLTLAMTLAACAQSTEIAPAAPAIETKLAKATATSIPPSNIPPTPIAPTEMAPTQAPSPTASTPWRVTGTEVPALAAFDETVREFMQARGISAGALAVIREGRLLMARGYTWDEDLSYAVRPESKFRIASLTKPITAVAILNLVQDLRLSLHDRVVDLLDLGPLPGQTADPRLGQVTVEHLLYHVGGWDAGALGFDPMFADRKISFETGTTLPISQADIISYMTGVPLSHDPGTTYTYSNYGYLLLGRVIEAVTGMSYEAYVQGEVLAPLGIEGMVIGSALPGDRASGEVSYHSSYTWTTVFDDTGAAVPAPDGGFNLANMDSHGGWVASVVDMAHFAASFDDPGAHPLLSAGTIEAMFSPWEGADPAPGDWYYAMGWDVRDFGDRRTTWHTGSLPGTHALMVRRWDGLGWVVLFNQREDESDPAGETYPQIDGMLHEAADAVALWPRHDLFEHYP